MSEEERLRRPIDAKDVLDYRMMVSGGFHESDILEIYAISWGLHRGDVMTPEEEALARRLTPAFRWRFEEIKRLAAEQESAERSEQGPG